MAQKTLLPSQMSAIVGAIDPDAAAAGTYTSGWISLANFQAIMATIMVGTMGGGGTINAKIEQATDDTGANAKDLNQAAITQLTQADGDADQQAIIEFYGEDLDLANNFTHARLSVTVAGAACDFGAVLMGCYPRYAPASDYDAATVAEIVSIQAAI